MISQGYPKVCSKLFNHLNKNQTPANGGLAGSDLVLELIC